MIPFTRSIHTKIPETFPGPIWLPRGGLRLILQPAMRCGASPELAEIPKSVATTTG